MSTWISTKFCDFTPDNFYTKHFWLTDNALFEGQSGLYQSCEILVRNPGSRMTTVSLRKKLLQVKPDSSDNSAFLRS
jgi:hypothetical protein